MQPRPQGRLQNRNAALNCAPTTGRNHVPDTDDAPPSRRDFLYFATASTGAVVVGAAGWGLMNQMNPSADVRAEASILVDIAGIAPGTQLTVQWQGKPVFIRRRTPAEIEAARAVALDQLIDRSAENANKPDATATDENRTLDTAGEWLVMVGVCTHLGCVPIGDKAGDFGGWFCPCHGSHYDTAGRIRKGPAPRNLDIPRAEFTDTATLRLG
ncbi:ubiquinol-cytochrome c reductase iron-sulfur subunit [Rhodobacteraceae bacterium]|nr:ubiquinol-cytochrome c reductase iron-sulfur subunit [Paracoccaceae bacterium]